MNSVDRVFVYVACLAVVGFVALSRVDKQESQRAVPCSVVRIVDDESDPAVFDPNATTPYTVLIHQPAWTTFNVPGDIGKPGDTVYVVPPAKDSSFSTH